MKNTESNPIKRPRSSASTEPAPRVPASPPKDDRGGSGPTALAAENIPPILAQSPSAQRELSPLMRSLVERRGRWLSAASVAAQP